MKIQMVDRPNTNPIAQDRETLTFKALLYLNVADEYAIVRLGSGKTMVSILHMDLISCRYI